MDQPPRFISTPSRGRNAYEITKAKPEIHELDEHVCQYCGATDSEIQLEHINPVSSNGINDPRNFISACAECNRAKGALPVVEFLESREGVIDDVSELPIHGDLIIDTPSLPKSYRQVRRDTIDQFRREGRFSGADAYKDLEKAFRRNLWTTNFGYWLTMRYPRFPGQARATIPIVETVLNDIHAPIFDFLLELTKKAETRRLIDDMLYYRLHDGKSAFESVVSAVTHGPQNEVQSKWIKTFGPETKFEIQPEMFESAPVYCETPINKRELHVIDIHDFREADGHLRGSVDGFEIRLTSGSAGSEMPVRIVDIEEDYALAVSLKEQYEPPEFDFDRGRVLSVIRCFASE
ncbi:MAG: HNH endonuclease [Halobacteriaceae archaeon]